MEILKPQGSVYLFNSKICFEHYVYLLSEYGYSPCRRYDFTVLQLPALDKELGLITRQVLLEDCPVIKVATREEFNKAKPSWNSGKMKLEEIYRIKHGTAFEKKAASHSYRAEPEKKTVTFYPKSSDDVPESVCRGVFDDLTLPIDATDEEYGAMLRKGLALCNWRKNEYLQLLYPEGNYPPEVVKFHGEKLLGGFKKVEPGVDGPHPFGMRTTWLAVRGVKDPLDFMQALGVFKYRATYWEQGVQKIMNVFGSNAVFVTPPIGDWSFVIWPMFPDKGQQRMQTFLARLSGEFGEAQVFGNERSVGYVLWGKAVKGRIVRWFYRTDEENPVSLGKVTKEEKALLEYGDESVDDWIPEEEDVLKIAEAWSLNPMEFAPGVPVAVGPGWAGTAMKG